MENKIIVEKGTFEYNDKEYSSYFIAGKIKGEDVKVALMPPDKGGWAVLDILFSDTNQGELVVKPYELKDEKTGKVTATGNTYAVRTVDENGEIIVSDGEKITGEIAHKLETAAKFDLFVYFVMD